MAKTKSSKSTLKRLRNSKKAQITNKSKKTLLKTVEKKFRAAALESDASKAEIIMKDLFSKLDKTAKIGVIHPNKASNKKSQISKLMNSIKK
jgi:small subunit ribosomal protein S20